MTRFTPKIAAGIAVALATATTAVSTAAAAGEPKNEVPFITAVAARGLALSHASAAVVARGEAKNQLPFTRSRAHTLVRQYPLASGHPRF